MMFRDAITELFETELQGRFTSRARSGMMSVLNYVGGYGKYRGEGGKGVGWWCKLGKFNRSMI